MGYVIFGIGWVVLSALLWIVGIKDSVEIDEEGNIIK